VDTLEREDPSLAAEMHFFVGDAMWQPGKVIPMHCFDALGTLHE